MSTIDFDELKKLRDKLLVSLRAWQFRGESYDISQHGLYGSQPKSDYTSYTCSGIVLQAFNESPECRNEAQELALRLIDKLRENRSDFLFPNITGGSPHVMSNAWPIFSVLDCLPFLIKKDPDNSIRKNIEWFLTNQEQDGHWDLYPNMRSKATPLWTAYSLSVLLQIYDRRNYFSIEDNDIYNLDRIRNAISQGIRYLIRNRSQAAKQNGIYLWALNPGETKLMDFSISTMCLHIIYKASRHLDFEELEEEEWRQKVEDTFEYLFERFDSNTNKFIINGNKNTPWGQVDELDGNNYKWNFFAPINLSTITRFASNPRFQNNNYYCFLKYLVDWIVAKEHEEKCSDLTKSYVGIRSGETITDISVWSTAQAVIAINRVLNAALDLQKIEKNIEFQNNEDLLNQENLLRNEEIATQENSSTRKVFLICGHNENLSSEVNLFIRTTFNSVDPEILAESPGSGQSIINRLEDYSNNAFYAIAILTPDDVGRLASEPNNLRFRARQNVIFELGYFYAKLSQRKVCILVEGDIEMPSDIGGIVWISIDERNTWRDRLRAEMRQAGFSFRS